MIMWTSHGNDPIGRHCVNDTRVVINQEDCKQPADAIELAVLDTIARSCERDASHTSLGILIPIRHRTRRTHRGILILIWHRMPLDYRHRTFLYSSRNGTAL